MHDWVEKLLILQDNDVRIRKLQAQLDSVPADKKATLKAIQDAELICADAKAKVKDVQKAIKNLELEVESANQKLQNFQAKSSMIKDNSEYRAAMTQIDGAKATIAQLEEKELVLMEELEQAKAGVAVKQKEVAASQQRGHEMLADLDVRAANCAKQLEVFKAKRAKAVEGVPSQYLRLYDRLRNGKRVPADGRVLVPVHNKMCGACHMGVTAQIINDARKGQSAICQNCGVILYYED